ncbi:large ribosomal subunit protein eL34-like [Populus alba]|uniref:large ribosomal subunit protein eL34-like n=1 Tax=Populus alba TaxID=43335 RepID=UPI003CC6ED16
MVQRLTYRKRHSNLTSTALSKPLVGNWYIKPPATWLVDPNVQLLERGFKGIIGAFLVEEQRIVKKVLKIQKLCKIMHLARRFYLPSA